MQIVQKIINRIHKIWSKPIYIFLAHQVRESFDEKIDAKNTFSDLSLFQSNILSLKKRYTFISLQEAERLLKRGGLRLKSYAVFTFDDAYKNIECTFDFLSSQKIPFTIFVNSEFMSETENGKYLSRAEIFNLVDEYITIGLHGYKHLNSNKLSESEFYDNVKCNLDDIKSHPRYIPFFAYPYGANKLEQDKTLQGLGLVPVLCDWNYNQSNTKRLSRYCIDGLDVNTIKIFWI